MAAPSFTPPFRARHVEISAIASQDDELSRPSARLLDVALAAVQEARSVSLERLSARLPLPPFYPEIWPGEHYKLLAGIVKVINPKFIIEIGTGGGLSALTFKEFSAPECRIVSFDVIGWENHPESVLRAPDFGDGRLLQCVEDLSNPLLLPPYLGALSAADLIFLDAAKDGATEPRILENLANVPFAKPPLLVLDDIKLWNMLRVWREIRKPKLDLTSFGHWSGTGLVDWI